MHIGDFFMDIKKAFDEGRFLDILDASHAITSPEDRLLLGISLYKLGKTHEALDVFMKIYFHIDFLSKALFYIGKIYKETGDEDLAEQFINNYLVFRPDDDEAKDLLASGRTVLMEMPSVELARLYTKQGYFEKAVDIYAKLFDASDDPSMKKEALAAQGLYIIKSLEGWLEGMRK